MKAFLASIVFMLVLIPVDIAASDHDFWAGAAFGAWGWAATTTLKWWLR